ncbi:CPBP family intramembrane glutamic endopeptidase [Halostella litorea]|uniref:CPBP family intramembrane glutamic endopeptidase n=1 Tax=Halostella litorea TaxID=2528831 RepID=UPI001092EAD0|nr:CPBP family intramembrane glutamic endopeptidase [Halostella litorea]
MLPESSLPAWGVALVLGLPLLDVVHSFTPWSRRLWTDHDHRAWTAYWSASVVLRWAQAGVAVAVLVAADASLATVGVRTPSTAVTAASAGLALVAAAWYGYVALRTPAVPRADAPTDYTTTYPADGYERALWFLAGGVTASVCEEFLYRGVAVAGLLGLGLPWPAAVLGAALAFALSHGLAVLNPLVLAFYVAIALGMTGVVAVTGSLLPAVAVHATINLASVARDLDDTTVDSVRPEAA